MKENHKQLITKELLTMPNFRSSPN